jgi:hypothetical protein
MKKLQFNVSIKAPAGRVYDRMLGISSKLTYEQWTALFNPTSTYEGNWKKEISENVPGRFVSIRHYGLVKANAEITEGPDVEKWANGFENYSFEEADGITTVKVELDTNEEFSEYMSQTYPKALDRLREICEA